MTNNSYHWYSYHWIGYWRNNIFVDTLRISISRFYFKTFRIFEWTVSSPFCNLRTQIKCRMRISSLLGHFAYSLVFDLSVNRISILDLRFASRLKIAARTNFFLFLCSFKEELRARVQPEFRLRTLQFRRLWYFDVITKAGIVHTAGSNRESDRYGINRLEKFN